MKEYLNLSIPININAPLWRYIDIKKLKSLLENKALYFTRADLLGDEHEGSYSRPTIDRRPIFFEGATDHFIKEGLPEMNKNWRLCTYINCWHVNESESHAMWKLYSKNNKSIAIKSSISLLRKSILETKKQFILGFINYIDYEKDFISEANSFTPFYYKQKIYSHENEFRIITDNVEKINEVASGKMIPEKGFLIKTEINSLIDKLIISPFSSQKYQNEVKKLLNQHNLLNKLIDSTINRKPSF